MQTILTLIDFSQDCKTAVFRGIGIKDRLLIKIQDIPNRLLPLLPIGRKFYVKINQKDKIEWIN